VTAETRQLILRMATANLLWRASRIPGELRFTEDGRASMATARVFATISPIRKKKAPHTRSRRRRIVEALEGRPAMARRRVQTMYMRLYFPAILEMWKFIESATCCI
jgi:hypothetical protein